MRYENEHDYLDKDNCERVYIEGLVEKDSLKSSGHLDEKVFEKRLSNKGTKEDLYRRLDILF